VLSISYLSIPWKFFVSVKLELSAPYSIIRQDLNNYVTFISSWFLKSLYCSVNFFVVLEFELRSSCLLSRCSITWITPPAPVDLIFMWSWNYLVHQSFWLHFDKILNFFSNLIFNFTKIMSFITLCNMRIVALFVATSLFNPYPLFIYSFPFCFLLTKLPRVYLSF
jgi:hypothetical protein